MWRGMRHLTDIQLGYELALKRSGELQAGIPRIFRSCSSADKTVAIRGFPRTRTRIDVGVSLCHFSVLRELPDIPVRLSKSFVASDASCLIALYRNAPRAALPSDLDYRIIPDTRA